MKYVVKSLLSLCTLCLIVWISLHLALPFPEQLLLDAQHHQSKLILDKHERFIDMRVGHDDQYRFHIKLDEISQDLIDATLAAEDQRFYQHFGVDPFAVCRALWQNTVYKKRISGASTISMQVVKLLHNKPRTYQQKLIEMWHAILLEQRLTKDEIITLYLNLAPYGGNLVGCEAAARMYFQKSCRDLSRAEAYLIAGLPQSPNRFNPLYHLDRALVRRDFILERLQALGKISKQNHDLIQKQKIVLTPPTRLPENIRLADHLIQLSPSHLSKIHSTIDLNHQTQIEQLLKSPKSHLQQRGIDGFSVVVLDAQDRSLKSLSNATTPSSWVDFSQTKRQPGSLLKPFLYSMAYENGALTPGQYVQDHSKQWGTYRPNNHDKRYMGIMTASQALMQSRNIPAVSLVKKIQPNKFWDKLQNLNLNLQQSSQNLGLSLALGTPEVGLLDMCNAYATLLNDGNYKYYKVIQSQQSSEKRVFQSGVSALTLYSLGARYHEGNWNVASKTGTSWQQRDAWCISMSPKYIVGVWLGLSNGQGHDALMGSDLAKPIAESVIESMTERDEQWDALQNLKYRTVCNDTGYSMSLQCQHQKREPYLPGISSSIPCKHPNSIIKHIKYKKAKKDLIFTSPLPNSQYLFQTQRTRNSLPIKLKHNPNQKLFWFLNGKYLKSTNANQHYWNFDMNRGSYELSVSDSEGNHSSINFEII